ncbi:MAG: hypothetical protein GY847_02240 [Proteobacteria bacterium]|nr:hypothetical protein [Pseudomonadota bacterium]
MSNSSNTPSPAFGAAATKMPILLVANPTSRSGKAARRFDRVKAQLDRYRLEHEFRYTLPEGKTMDMVSQAVDKEGFRTVICLGGDGTFNDVAKGVCRSGKPREVRIGMLPAGTANDQGKSFGISSAIRAIEKNVKTIAEGHTTQLDVGEVKALSESGIVQRRDLFFDSVGWGLSAAILAFRNYEREIVNKLPVVRDMYRDQMVYVRAAVRELALSWVTRDRFTAIIQMDGETRTLDKLTDLVVSNTIIYAGEWITDPEAKHCDGQLEVVSFRGVRDWTSKLILNHKKIPLTEEMVNRIGVSHSPTYRGSKIRLRFIKPTKQKRLLAHLDGEEFPPADCFEIRVHKRLLNLIVPENYHWI